MSIVAKPTVWLAPSAFAPHIGGVEHTVRRLARGLQDRGHPVVVVTHRHPADLPGFEEIDGIPVFRVTFPSPTAAPSGLVRGGLAIAPALRALSRIAPRPEVVHVHGASIQLPVLTAYCSIRRVPLVVTTHGEVVGDDHAIFDVSAYLRTSLKVAARCAAALTAVSRSAREGAAAVAPRFAGASVIANGVDADEWDIPAPTPAPVFGAWGRHERAKGFDVLLEAFALVRASQPAAQLVLGGAGSQALTKVDGVEFVGRLDRDGVRDLLTRIRVVVIPSRAEAFGLVALEAMGAGRQIVWSDLPGMREATAGLGFPVVPDDPHALASAMLFALAAGEDTAVLRARASALSWDRALRAYSDIYWAAVR